MTALWGRGYGHLHLIPYTQRNWGSETLGTLSVLHSSQVAEPDLNPARGGVHALRHYTRTPLCVSTGKDLKLDLNHILSLQQHNRAQRSFSHQYKTARFQRADILEQAELQRQQKDQWMLGLGQRKGGVGRAQRISQGCEITLYDTVKVNTCHYTFVHTHTIHLLTRSKL